jgi:hypothetical protein
MKKCVRFLLSLPLLLSASHMALAAATPKEAKRLTAVFQSYLGTVPGVVTVEPKGDNYAVTFDFTPLIAKAQDAQAAFSISPIELEVADNGGGKWGVSQDGPIGYTVKAADKISAEVKAESYKWQGIFDEKLATFETSTGEVKNMTVTESIDDPTQGKMNVSATIKSAKIEQSGVANSNGGADLKINYTLEGLSETMATNGDPQKGIPPLNLVLTADNAIYETVGKGYRVKSILDVVAFLVSHPSKKLILKDQQKLKAALTSSLPLFENTIGKVDFNKVSVATPLGPVRFDRVTVGVDMNGIVKDGKLRESITMTGISVPQAIVPPWAKSLVPKEMTFDIQGSGFDLATPANLILKTLNFSKEPPLPAGFEKTLLPAVLPNGNAEITLHPTSISNDLYTISAEGSMTAGPNSVPSGKAKVKAKGLDEIMKVIQSAPPEMGLQTGTAVIIAAKGMGKAESDGTITWNIESAPGGKVLVNGIDISQIK